MTTPAASPHLRQLGGQALVSVLQALLRIPAADLTEVPATAPGSGDPGITASVVLGGPTAEATVCLIISLAFLSHAATTLLGAKPDRPVSDPLLEDLAGELCNMVAGKVAEGLRHAGLACSLGTPRLHRQPGSLPAPGTAVQCGRSDWSWQGLPIAVELRCRPT